MATSIRSWARGQAMKGRAPAYIYMYAHPHPYAPGVTFADHDPGTAGAYHSSEIPYFLQTQDVYNRFRLTRNWTAYDRELADQLSDVIVEFARSGNPATRAVPMLPYDLKREQLMEFSDSIRVTAFDPARMNFFATVNLPGAVGPTATPRLPRD